MSPFGLESYLSDYENDRTRTTNRGLALSNLIRPCVLCKDYADTEMDTEMEGA